MRAITLSLLALFALLLTACGGSGAPSSTTAPGTQAPAATTAVETDVPAQGQPTPGTALNACEVVTPADIEAALGLEAGTVDEGELEDAATVLDPASTDCHYTGDWGGLVVALTPTDGVNVFDAVVGSRETEDLGLGDGAVWSEDESRGFFLAGPVMLRLQFTHLTSGEFDSFREPTVALGEAFLEKL
jgi:hypothetical protein